MSILRGLIAIGVASCMAFGATRVAHAQTIPPAQPPSAPVPPTPGGAAAVPATPQQAPVAPKGPPSIAPAPAPPEPKPQATPPSAPSTSAPGTTAPPAGQLAPSGKPQTQEYEPNASPTTPRVTTTETVEVPARPVVMVKGEASFDDAFKSIKAALDKAKAALAKAGLTQTGHELAIVTDTDDKGIKFEAAVPIAVKPAGKSEPGKSEPGKSEPGTSETGKPDLGDGVTIADSPAGRALKFRHRGPYDEIDRTYATITSYLDNKGLEATSPFIEEYPGDLTSDDDPRLAVDIYIFIKK